MTQTAGRPRAQGTDGKLTTAALEVYGLGGWDALSLAAAAQRAGVGKSSAYLRWSTKIDLLTAAFAVHGAHVEDVDTGSVRSDLIALAMNLHDLFVGPAGAANLRLVVDAAHVAELQALETEIRRTQIAAARRIVQRGIAREEVPRSTSIGLLLSAVCGGVQNHVLTSPRTTTNSPTGMGARDFCEALVDLVLRGLS